MSWMRTVHSGCGSVMLIAVAIVGCGPKVGTDDSAGGNGSGRDTQAAPESTSAMSSSGDAVTSGEGGASTSVGNREDMPKFDISLETTGPDDCQPWALEGCSIEAPGFSLVHGGTPLGEIPPEPQYAFFSGGTWCEYCIGTIRLDRFFFVSDPGLMKDVHHGQLLPDGLELDLGVFEAPVGEEIEGSLVFRRDGEEATTQAIFVVHELPPAEMLGEPFDPTAPAMISGTLYTVEDGWSLHGDFAATYCPQANAYAICE